MPADPSKKKSRNGPIVALAVLALCVAAFFATTWNYSRTHPFADNAEVVLLDGAPRISAVFPVSKKIQTGQRVVVSIENDTIPARGGRIIEIDENGRSWIELDTEIPSPAGTRATVSIDGTVGPQTP
jgi:hypothetical protein